MFMIITSKKFILLNRRSRSNQKHTEEREIERESDDRSFYDQKLMYRESFDH